MTIDPHEAAASLSDIAKVEQRTRETLVYGHSGVQFMLWGVLVAAGYIHTYLDPVHADAGWIAVTVLGLGGSIALRRLRLQPSRDGRLGRLIGYAQFVLLGYGLALLWLLAPMTHRQAAAFWPMLVMLGMVLAGLWQGRFFIYCGLTVSALVLAGYVWSGGFYTLWLALVVGGGLIAAGLWLRRMS